MGVADNKSLFCIQTIIGVLFACPYKYGHPEAMPDGGISRFVRQLVINDIVGQLEDRLWDMKYYAKKISYHM